MENQGLRLVGVNPSGSTSVPPGGSTMSSSIDYGHGPAPDDQQQDQEPKNPPRELDILIAKYLLSGPYAKTGQALVHDLELNQAIPPSTNWQGDSIAQDFKTFNSKISHHIGPDYLNKLLSKLLVQSNSKDAPGSTVSVSSSSSSMAIAGPSATTSVQCSSQSKSLLSLSTSSLAYGRTGSLSRSGQSLITHPICHRANSNPSLNIVNSILMREHHGTSLNLRPLDPDFLAPRFRLAKRTLGHMKGVYCCLFDQSGNYILTGADDMLVKVWNAHNGRLVSTLRGNTTEITDIAINMENTLVACGSLDRVIRVWLLSTGELLQTLIGHNRSVTSVFFCPMPRKWMPVVRYLGSTGRDGTVCFWAYKDVPGERIVFEPTPTQFHEKIRPGTCQMTCSAFSPGGVFFGAGNTDHNVRVYYMLDINGPRRILENQTHTDFVDSIAWAHSGVRFVTGSKDGLALIWRLDPKAGGWRYTKIDVRFPEGNTTGSRKISRVTMVSWSCDDRFVFTASQTATSQDRNTSTISIKVWNSEDGSILRILQSHTELVYVVEPHPHNPRILCTAGHDGKIIIWDIGSLLDPDLYSGKKIYEYKDTDREAGLITTEFFDAKWSPDGTKFIGTDAKGHLMIFTMCGKSGAYDRIPNQLFFHTDYSDLSADAITGAVLDQQSQVPPHLMPPPFLVRADGTPYEVKFQRLVPGRENCRDEQLIPNANVNPGIQQIDELIAHLTQPVLRNRTSFPGTEHEIIRDVRHTFRGNWQTSSSALPPIQTQIVPPLTPSILQNVEDSKVEHGELEESIFKFSSKKSGNETSISGSGSSQAVEELSYHSRRLRELAEAAAQQRRIEEERRRNAEEGVPLPNPPQRELSVSQFPSWFGIARRNRELASGGRSDRYNREIEFRDYEQEAQHLFDDPHRDPNFTVPANLTYRTSSESSEDSSSENSYSLAQVEYNSRRLSLRPRNRNSNLTEHSGSEHDSYHPRERQLLSNTNTTASRRSTRLRGGRRLNSPDQEPESLPPTRTVPSTSRERIHSSRQHRLRYGDDEEYNPPPSRPPQRTTRSVPSQPRRRGRPGRRGRGHRLGGRRLERSQGRPWDVIPYRMDAEVDIQPQVPRLRLRLRSHLEIEPEQEQEQTETPTRRTLRANTRQTRSLPNNSSSPAEAQPSPSPVHVRCVRYLKRTNVVHSDPESEEESVETPPPPLRSRSGRASRANMIQNEELEPTGETPSPPTLSHHEENGATPSEDDDDDEEENEPQGDEEVGAQAMVDGEHEENEPAVRGSSDAEAESDYVNEESDAEEEEEDPASSESQSSGEEEDTSDLSGRSVTCSYNLRRSSAQHDNGNTNTNTNGYDLSLTPSPSSLDELLPTFSAYGRPLLRTQRRQYNEIISGGLPGSSSSSKRQRRT